MFRVAGPLTAVAGISALAAVATGLALAYVAGERTVYYWDFANFHNMARAEAAALRSAVATSPSAVLAELRDVRQTTGGDYNDLHTLAVVPLLWAFGESRAVYVAAVTLGYLLPLALAVGAVARRLLPTSPRQAFWGGAAITLLAPGAVVPTLYGYPDAGAAALTLAAVAVYLGGPALRWGWRAPVIGASLALAMLLRRHFAYDAAAFAVVAAPHSLALAWRRDQLTPAWRRGLAQLARWTPSLAAGALTLGLIGGPFVRRQLTTGFGDLYASYEVLPGESLRYFLRFHGCAMLLLAALGYAVAGRRRVLDRDAASFFLPFGAVVLALWTAVVRQTGAHYALHFAAFVAVGVLAAAIASRRRPMIAAIVVLVAVNAVVALAPPTASGLTRLAAADAGPVWRAWLVASFAPERRADYDELGRLVRFLRLAGKPGGVVFVAASSSALNEDVLALADREPGGSWRAHPDRADDHRTQLNVSWTPAVDSRDPYPLEHLLRADLVVAATPFQHHLRADRQRVVRVAHDAFAEGWEIAADFVPLPQMFTLAARLSRLPAGQLARHPADGEPSAVAVHVYRRVRATSVATAVRTLDRMRREIGAMPGGQPPWLVIAGGRATAGRSRGGAYDAAVAPDDRGGASTLVAAEPVMGEATVRGVVTLEGERCANVVVQALGLDAAGAGVAAGAAPATSHARREAAHLQLQLGGAVPYRVALRIGAAAAPGTDLLGPLPAGCTVRLTGLRVAPRSGSFGDPAAR